MVIFTLVDDVEKPIETLRIQHGEFTLAMLYNDTLDAVSGWNLIVSAPWTDAMGSAETIRLIARVLDESLSLENKRAISRITVLKTSDSFVRDMTRLYAVKPGSHIPLSQVTAGEITEGSGFILYSQKVA
jgi:hypothetical protein